jgi:hypothetical protein
MRMRVHVMSNANPIWCDPASVGRKPRRAESVATSLRGDRAGIEPRLGGGSAHESSRPQRPGSKQLSGNTNPAPRLKSGAESRLELAQSLARRDFRPTNTGLRFRGASLPNNA